MRLSHDHVEPSQTDHVFTRNDVSATASHVGCNGNACPLARSGNDQGLRGQTRSIEDLTRQATLGQPLADDEDLRRGDLIFWAGHVALVANDTRLIHANAHAMAVCYEDIDTAIARIQSQGGGPVTARKRSPE